MESKEFDDKNKKKKYYKLNEYVHDDFVYHLDTGKDFIGFLRKKMVREIQTPEGLRQYIFQHYRYDLKDREQLSAILSQVKTHFKSEPTDSKWLKEELEKMKIQNEVEALDYLFFSELKPILSNSGVKELVR